MKEMLMKAALSIALVVMSLAVATAAEDSIRTERVQFKKGTSGATIKDKIKGYEIVDYKLNAKAGQSMVVNLKTNHLANYFNVMPPGSDTAIFIGSTSGNHYEGELPSDGDYTVRVYLMRSAARRGEKANYTLEIGISGKSK